MKRCHTCRKVLPDGAMVLCPYDGTPLLDTMISPDALADTLQPEDKANEEEEVNLSEAKRSNQRIREGVSLIL